MPKPTYLRFASDAGEFSAPASRKAALVKEGARVLDKPATNANGDPLPYKPKTSVAAPARKAPEPERQHGQKAATADNEEKV